MPGTDCNTMFLLYNTIRAQGRKTSRVGGGGATWVARVCTAAWSRRWELHESCSTLSSICRLRGLHISA